MYKISAYKITLKRRYTIAQNIKSLAYLFPSVLIYGALAQSGSLIAIIFQTLNLPAPPMGLTHIDMCA
uniref:Uncharacterized protein n=1 Tax=Panagrolaimus davidi TaxID=227884 RepID=A0A914P2A1_9BILA